MSKNLDGKTALVTGGSRGIGRAVVEDLCACGANVTFTFVKENCAARGWNAVPVRCDSRDSQAVTSTVEEIVSGQGKLDILVCNAGITRDQYLMMMKEEDFVDVIQTNLVGAFRFAKAACRPMMTAKSGAIVTVRSPKTTTLWSAAPSPGP